ncbi:MAG TPA: glycosyl hydrolase family 18 protein [Gammaproteobacteria bacterium]|nr:glycosyl hydrolase family 18 protein [Gammaproteobacteria bacterium]
MRILALTLSAFGTALLLCACKYGGNPSPAPNRIVLGYYTGDPASLTSAESTANPVNEVAMDQVTVDANGNLQSSLTASLLASDASEGKLTYVTVSNFGAVDFDPAIAHGAMVTHRGNTIGNLVALAKAEHITGINIDFEGIYPSDRTAYSEFVANLAVQLHAANSLLMLSVPAKSSDNPSDDWTWPYDYPVIGKSADFIQVMTYDEHVPGQGPGPVAGIDWMQASLIYAVSQIQHDKVLLGLPAYGYDFDVTHNTGVQVDWKDTDALIASTGAVPSWQATTESEHFDYTASDGSMHQVWYETPQGIRDKSHLAVELNLAGVSVWALGFENMQFWDAVAAGLG